MTKKELEIAENYRNKRIAELTLEWLSKEVKRKTGKMLNSFTEKSKLALSNIFEKQDVSIKKAVQIWIEKDSRTDDEKAYAKHILWRG